MNDKMRVYHRYLGFFLSGIMAVYALSGIIMIFRNTDFLKRDESVEKQLAPGLNVEQVGKELRMRDLKPEADAGNIINLPTGTYDKQTGQAKYTVRELPYVLHKMTDMHKATTKSPLFFMNIFFGVSLLFFVISAFYMFMPKTSVFKKGVYFALAGVVLTLIMILF